MSAERIPTLIFTLVLCVVLGGLGWFFYEHLEPSWDPVQNVSDAAAKDPMLGAERLLQKHGYRVAVDRTLSLALFQPLPQGTLILAEGGDNMLPTQAQALLSWVERGNTLVVTAAPPRYLFDAAAAKRPNASRAPQNAPKAPSPSKDKAAEEASDSIVAHFGVTTASPADRSSICRPLGKQPAAASRIGDDGRPRFTYVDCVATLNLPGVAHPLRLDVSRARLASAAEPADASRQARADEEEDRDGRDDDDAAAPNEPDAAQADASDGKESGVPAPVLADDDAKALRIYAYGKGRVAILAQQYFDNYDLAAYDHGELLLGLAALDKAGRNVTLIQRVDIASWFRILWHAAPYAVCTLAAFLLLWAWSAMRRFGPQLPDPDDRRRALLEHVDASGRWLWKSAKGREIMLAAVRRATERALSRRIPELRKLAPERQVERIAADGKMGRADIERALLDAPGRLPIEFTHQIQILQELRAHYER